MPKKRKGPAEDRTVDLFTGMTRLEEDSATATESLVTSKTRVDGLDSEHSTIVEWLGRDSFSIDDDVRIAVSGKRAVIVLVSAYSNRMIALTPKQWAKLKRIIKES